MAEQIFQIAAKALIRDPKGDILMVHLPKWGHNPEHWDVPGGRVDPGETFLDTLKREIKEELGIKYIGKPKQLMGMLTNITIPVGKELLPLVFMLYEVRVSDAKTIMLQKGMREDDLKWFSPKKAADLMKVKFSTEFCDLVRGLGTKQ